MTGELSAEFEKRFPDGFVLRFQMRCPSRGASCTAIFGPSGCGKTTVLRCLAGLERPDAGTIRFDGQVWFDASQRITLTPQSRNVGFMFQDYSLFPHLDVRANIAFGLARLGAQERRRRVDDLLDRFELHGLERRYPRRLSGGQQQRVALARTIARKPSLLLLDEPLTALDGPTRGELRLELRRFLADVDVPVVIVTHDAVEAVTLADDVLVMDDGVVRQQGTVEDVFSRPVDSAVARIVGVETVLRGKVQNVTDGLVTVAVGGHQLAAVGEATLGGEVDLFLRAEDVALVRAPIRPGSVQNHLPARIVAVVPEGPMTRVVLDCGFRLTALVTRRASVDLQLAEGNEIIASIKAVAIHVVPRHRSVG